MALFTIIMNVIRKLENCNGASVRSMKITLQSNDYLFVGAYDT